ncbi:hypothetical protein TcWFU_002535 [Taenia crassiceps]|uniref:Uncharacterized protein n=1 Tax=Taenia crassiceps TaxID=6207 RepID=A0ABR4Q1G1_9CEST
MGICGSGVFTYGSGEVGSGGLLSPSAHFYRGDISEIVHTNCVSLFSSAAQVKVVEDGRRRLLYNSDERQLARESSRQRNPHKRLVRVKGERLSCEQAEKGVSREAIKPSAQLIACPPLLYPMEANEQTKMPPGMRPAASPSSKLGAFTHQRRIVAFNADTVNVFHRNLPCDR